MRECQGIYLQLKLQPEFLVQCSAVDKWNYLIHLLKSNLDNLAKDKKWFPIFWKKFNKISHCSTRHPHLLTLESYILERASVAIRAQWSQNKKIISSLKQKKDKNGVACVR